MTVYEYNYFYTFLKLYEQFKIQSDRIIVNPIVGTFSTHFTVVGQVTV